MVNMLLIEGMPLPSGETIVATAPSKIIVGPIGVALTGVNCNIILEKYTVNSKTKNISMKRQTKK